MNQEIPVAVVTTIQSPTESIHTLLRALKEVSCPLLIIGDKRGPYSYDAEGAELFTFEQQTRLPYKLAALLPSGHYTRKNLGYLLALDRGATGIYETDDDNAPLPGWRWRNSQTSARPWAEAGWANVYRIFSDANIWPRGFLLDLIQQPSPRSSPSSEAISIESPIQQGLANGSPDVDAIWRLVFDDPVTFKEEASVYLPRNVWCPFNSQSTWWRAPAYPLMYLPSNCSFRMTDIWRSFIAQRCLWEMDTGVVFHSAEVVQARNVHRLMKDFEDEISGYLRNREIVQCLEEISLQPGPNSAARNLLKCYETLVARSVFPSQELDLVRAWLEDLERL
jgi:STELLO glycosyltransferases